MKLAWLDCAAGVSGDMLLAAMIDAGADPGLLKTLPAALGLDGCRVDIRETARAGFRALRVEVRPGEEKRHRSLATVRETISRAAIADKGKAIAIGTFELLARAEAKAHGCGVEEVHFHETGAADALIDITGAALLFLDLGIDELLASPLPMPQGAVECSHGAIPLPAPALAGILEGAEVYGVPWREECVTPTGAAITMTLAAGFGPMPAMRLAGVGCGAGARERSGPLANILRLFTGKGCLPADEVEIIECNIDDMTPELAANLVERLLEAGALDACLLPVMMKKGRPGFQLQVIARPGDGPGLRELVFRESSTIGLRYRRQPRLILPRQTGTVATAAGRVKAKMVTGPDGPRITPEYEDCRRIARQRNLPLTELYRAVATADPKTFEADE